jgi:hypothetical protein
MKKQVIKTLFFFVVMAIIGLTCKKYPEGPLISLRSAEKRIIGKWEIKEVKINGHDKINDIDSLAIDYYHFYLSEYCKSKRGTDEWCPELYVEIIDKKELKLILFSWGLNDKKRNISFSKFSYSFPVNSPPPTT